MIEKMNQLLRYGHLLFADKEQSVQAIFVSSEALKRANQLNFESLLKAIYLRAQGMNREALKNRGPFFDLPLESRMILALSVLFKISLVNLEKILEKNEIEIEELIYRAKE